MDKDSDEAAAQLYRLAEATALLRLYRESEAHEAESPQAVQEWRKHHPGPSEPTEADYEVAARAYPDVAARAHRSNPFLSGNN